jgi:hypothetical protein
LTLKGSMAPIFCDGFDNYTTLANLWDLVAGAAPTLSATYQRFAPPAGLPGQGVKFGTGAYARKNLAANTVTFIAGFAFYLPALSVGSTAHLFAVLDGTTTQVSLGCSASGTLQFYRNEPSGGTAIGVPSAGGLIGAGTWHFLELEIKIDPSAGTVAVYLDGSLTPAISSTGLNTQNTGDTYANVIQIGDYSNALPSGIYYDDLRVFDTTGSYCNSLIGDTQVFSKVPSGAGALTEWTPNGSTPNYNCVNSVPPNTSKFVSSATAGQEDTYAVPSAGLTINPAFVMTRHYAQKDDSIARSFQPVVRSNSVDALGTANVLPSSWKFFDSFFENDPNTSALWTAAAADVAQPGHYETT